MFGQNIIFGSAPIGRRPLGPARDVGSPSPPHTRLPPAFGFGSPLSGAPPVRAALVDRATLNQGEGQSTFWWFCSIRFFSFDFLFSKIRKIEIFISPFSGFSNITINGLKRIIYYGCILRMIWPANCGYFEVMFDAFWMPIHVSPFLFLAFYHSRFFTPYIARV